MAAPMTQTLKCEGYSAVLAMTCEYLTALGIRNILDQQLLSCHHMQLDAKIVQRF